MSRSKVRLFAPFTIAVCGAKVAPMWDERYAEDGFAYGTEPNDFLRERYADIPAGGRVLCVADGEGRNSVFLATQGYAVTAVDQSAVGLEKAQKLAAEKGVTLQTKQANLADFDLGEDAWDGVVSISAHLPPALRGDLHRRVVRALCPSGVILLEAYTKEHLSLPGVGGPPAAQQEMLMSLEGLKEELVGLTILWGKELEREMSEGKYHHGLSGVVQFIAAKP